MAPVNRSDLFKPLPSRDGHLLMVSIEGRDPGFVRLPYALKILCENIARHQPEECDAFRSWLEGGGSTDAEVQFYPSRVLTHDTTCVPALVDLAALRDAVVARGGDPSLVNPQIPFDLVIDHSVIVDRAGSPDAFAFNLQRDFERNAERYAFIRWAQDSFHNFRVIPPATGILHQVNLEHLSEVVRVIAGKGADPIAVPDTLVGTDSHTPMVNALGILAWGVGGLEGEAVALGQPISLRVPEVVGVRLTGKMRPGVTATDLALTLTERLRKIGVVEKVVEFFGPGMACLRVADRATVSNMAPEYGATCAFFPIDARTLDYLRLIGKPDAQVQLVEDYARAQGLWHDSQHEPVYTQLVECDLESVEPSMAGPTRPQDRVSLADVPESFLATLGSTRVPVPSPRTVDVPGETYTVRDGSVLIAAITSCTNTSNPALMIAAGLLARKARVLGLRVPPWVKTSFAPGSRAVSEYLERSGLQDDLDALGFHLVGYGCTTCIGNSGEVDPTLAGLAAEERFVGVAVLSGNRNFEGRINPAVRAAYLGSPALVVAYALAGSVLVNLSTDPLGTDAAAKPVYLADIWPSDEEVEAMLTRYVTTDVFAKHAADLLKGPEAWQRIAGSQRSTFAWREASTYLRRPPFLDEKVPRYDGEIRDARLLLMLGDSVTTDHISPAGAIPVESAAGRYLLEHGVAQRDFNQYSTRRGNFEVMLRGAFSNTRLRNELCPGEQGNEVRTVVQPGGEALPIHDAIERYRSQGTQLIVVAGADYGGGSSRDWAAKGPALAGVRAIIAESFERIHRSNLIGMGILPLQFVHGMTRHDLALDGTESFSVRGIEGELRPMQSVTLVVSRTDGNAQEFPLQLRVQTAREIEYLKCGGLLPYVLEQLLATNAGVSSDAEGPRSRVQAQ
jgi:aconitate hydratase